MGSRDTRPENQPMPLLLRFVLRLFASRDERNSVVSDLRELYDQKLSSDGEAAARAWLRGQARQHVARLPADWLLGVGFRKPGASQNKAARTGLSERIVNLFHDFRRSARTLARAPVFTFTIVSTIGLGIGGTTAVFALVNAILIEPLPYKLSDQLWRVYTATHDNRWPFSVADYLAFKEEQTSFEAVAAFRTRTMTLNLADRAERVPTREITPGYFGLLGVSAVLGRTLIESDGFPASSPTTLVSHGFWQRVLGSDSDAVGQTIRLNGIEYTIAGVLPQRLGPLDDGREVFPALRLQPPARKGPFFLTPLGRLKRNVALDAARSEMRSINQRLFPVWQNSYTDRESTWGITSLKEFIIGDVGTSLTVALGAVIFVLLIASTNAANLLVARTTQRRGELAVRAALGASRGDLARHLSTESALLAGLGAGLGLLLAYGGIQLAAAYGADFLPRAEEIGFSRHIAGFFLVVTMGSCLIFSVPPAVGATTPNLGTHLKAGGERHTVGKSFINFRRVAVGLQFAVSVPLLVGAGLLVASLARLNRVDPGFDTTNVLTIRISLPTATYAPQALPSFWDDVTSQVGGLPGVRSVGVSVARPPQEYPFSNNQNLMDKPTPPGESQIAVPWNSATPEFFEVLGVHLSSGRMFGDNDSLGVLVDDAWADRFYPEGNVIGKRFTSGGCTSEECRQLEVIGTVGDVKYSGLERANEGTVYMNFDRFPNWTAFLTLRTYQEPMGILSSVRSVVRTIDPGVPLSDVATMDELMRDSLQAPRYLTSLVAGFGIVALLLSVVGIYGVMSYFVQQHSRDIGIRIALGGGPANVKRMIVGRGMRVVLAGVTVGVGGAIVLTRYMESLLYQVAATDASTIASASVVIVGLAFVACLLPATRASRTDPATTLRMD